MKMFPALMAFILVPSSWMAGVEAQQDLEFEILRKLEIERIKSKILDGLGMQAPPDIAGSPTDVPKDVLQMLAERDEEKPSQPPSGMEDWMIFPNHRNFQCLWHNGSQCSRFEFSLFIHSTSEFWIPKASLSSSENLTISVLCSSSGEELRKVKEGTFGGKNISEKWVVVEFPLLDNMTFWNEKAMCAIEILGMDIDKQAPYLPFLKMSKALETRVRKRKTEGSVETTSGCRAVPFNISFEEIGWSAWILQPEFYEANLCKGYCLRVQNHHENFVNIMFQKNPRLEEEYGRCWATCCRPNNYRPLSMLYVQKDNIIIRRDWVNMAIDSCACR